MQNYRFFSLLLVLALPACNGNEMRDTLGLTRKAPDEFVVYSRPPLSVPPEFELRPPRPGEEGPGASSTEAQARALLLGTKESGSSTTLDAFEEPPSVETAVTPVITNDAPTGAQATFLDKAGAAKADTAIRDQLVKDAAAEPKKKKKAESLYESIIGKEKNEPVVDAKKEAERIRANRDSGKPITEGETPSEDTKSRSLLDTLF